MNTILQAYRLTKGLPAGVRTAVLNRVAQTSASPEFSHLKKTQICEERASIAPPKQVLNESKPIDISDDVLRDAFNVTVEKIFDALSPTAFDLELKNADKKHLFFADDSLASAFTNKYESIKHFHEQGLFFKEFLYRVRKKKRQVEK